MKVSEPTANYGVSNIQGLKKPYHRLNRQNG